MGISRVLHICLATLCFTASVSWAQQPSDAAKPDDNGATPFSMDLEFDAYQGHTPGYSPAMNPHPDASHAVNAHLRFDFSKRWFKSDQRGLATFAYADNLTNTPIWLPDWGSGTPNTIPVNRGRTIFFGIEV